MVTILKNMMPSAVLGDRRKSAVRIWLSVCLLNLFVVGLTGIFLYQSRQQYFEQAGITTGNLAQVLEENISGIFSKADNALLSTIDEIDRQKARGGIDAARMNAYVRETNKHLAFSHGVRIANAAGDIEYVPPPAGVAINIKDRDYFVRLQQSNEPGLVISPPLVGRTSGERVIVLARRITDQDGAFAGEVHIALPIDHFENLLSSLKLGSKGSVAFMTDEPQVIARYPALTTAQQAIPLVPFPPDLRAILFSGRALPPSRMASPLDHITRTFTMQKLGEYPLLLIVGLADSDVLTEWRREAYSSAGLILIFMLITVLTARKSISDTRQQMASEKALRISDDLFRKMFDLSPIGMARNSMDGGFVEANAAYCNTVGYSLDALTGLRSWDLTPKEYEMQEALHLDTLKGTGRYGPYEKEYIRPDGSLVPVCLNGVLVESAQGEPFILSVVEDISARRRTESETQLAASVFHVTQEAIVVTDAAATILSINPAFMAITGYTPEDVLGKNPRLLKSDRHDIVFYEEMWRSLIEFGTWQGELWNRRKDGEVILVWQSITAVRNEAGGIERFVAVFSDITELRSKDDQLKRQAHYDTLTGLANRLLLQDRLDHAIDIARRSGEMVATLFLDLDRFKVVNDSLGHFAGDQLLKIVSTRLQTVVRKTDTLARLGGDEFVIVLTDFKDTFEVAAVAAKILARLEEAIILSGQTIHVGVSIGIAVFPQDIDDAVSALKNADIAMYEAKAAGRGTFRFFDSSMHTRASERLALEADLRHAIEHGEFELYYQPKLNIATGRPDGAEALIRWNHPTRGMVAPDSFIPLAEETGLIIPIGDWVLQEACRQTRRWRDDGHPPVRIAVNISARQFQDEQLPERLDAILAAAGVPAGTLEIELTESSVMRDPQKAIVMLRRIRALGIKIAVDDFGTGYSSLAYLKRFPIGAIKIDRSFVQDLGSNPEDVAIVRSIIVLGQMLGLEIVAEGVETDEQLAILQTAGCTTAQGYLHSKPLPAADFLTWLTARKR